MYIFQYLYRLLIYISIDFKVQRKTNNWGNSEAGSALKILAYGFNRNQHFFIRLKRKTEQENAAKQRMQVCNTSCDMRYGIQTEERCVLCFFYI